LSIDRLAALWRTTESYPGPVELDEPGPRPHPLKGGHALSCAGERGTKRDLSSRAGNHHPGSAAAAV